MNTSLWTEEFDDYCNGFEPAMWAGPPRTVDAAASVTGTLSAEQARLVRRGWIRRCLQDRREGTASCAGTVLSIFDRTGNWARPWALAGYDVRCLDLESEVTSPADIFDFCRDWAIDHGMENCDVVLAQPPCTDFASSGARWFADKDADGRTALSIRLVQHTLDVIGWLKPLCWAMENPIGRIGRLLGLPRPALRFHPHHYGDPYTKRTQLWGNFNPLLPQANVHPSEGSRMHRLRGDVPEQKRARSITPAGFALAFYVANRTFARRFDSAFATAGGCGLSEMKITAIAPWFGSARGLADRSESKAGGLFAKETA